MCQVRKQGGAICHPPSAPVATGGITAPGPRHVPYEALQIWRRGIKKPEIPRSAAAAATHSLYLGFRSTRMTESPRRNILLIKRSLFTGLLALAPLPRFGICGGQAQCLLDAGTGHTRFPI